MKKRVLAVALTACLSLGVSVPALAESPAQTSNIGGQNYLNWDTSPVDSFLFQTANGVTRVEHSGSVALVEEYDVSYGLLDSVEIRMELPIWGGFFAGSEYNFFVFGQSNPVESDSVEVIRVVKYSKDWRRLGAASVRGANTSVPFYCGSLRMAEAEGMLYIRTSHQMYASSGQGSQANMTLAVRQSDMAVTDMAHLVADVGCGYVSHSFNQFLLTDAQGRIVALDQGDNFPERRAVLSVFSAGAGSEDIRPGSVTSLELLSYPLEEGGDYRITGCSIGGFGETEEKYVAAYSYDGAGVSATAADRSVYLASVDKQTGEVTSVCLSSPGASTPQLALNGLEGGYILWNVTDTAGMPTGELRYAPFDSQGVPGQVRSAVAPLSDCAPIFVDGKAVWYVTDGGAPVFYELSDEGVRRYRAGGGFSDVPEDDAMYEAVMWSYMYGFLSPEAEGIFGKSSACPRSQVILALWRVSGSPESESDASPFTDVAPDDEYYRAVIWAYEKGITTGTSDDAFGPNAPVTRRDAVTFLFRAVGAKAPSTAKNPFSDVPEGQYYTDPVLWAVDRGITLGVASDSFAPTAEVTKAELAAFLYRWQQRASGSSE